MAQEFSRSEMLLGKDAMEKLKNSHIAVFGIGGVGGYTVEALARCGIGELTLVDNDTVSVTNINRQIIALHSTIGLLKTQAAKNRALDINPDLKIHTLEMFFTPENKGEIDFSQFDYVVDAIDTVSGKIALAQACQDAGVPLISSMGTGNKLNPTDFQVADIYKTSMCPLAKVMRHELKKRGIKKLKVVYSKEEPKAHKCETDEIQEGRRSIPASVSFVPSVAGLIIAGEVIKDLS